MKAKAGYRNAVRIPEACDGTKQTQTFDVAAAGQVIRHLVQNQRFDAAIDKIGQFDPSARGTPVDSADAARRRVTRRYSKPVRTEQAG